MKNLLIMTAMAALACSAIAMPMTEENLDYLVKNTNNSWELLKLTNKWERVMADTNLVFSESVGYLIYSFEPANVSEMPEKIATAYTNKIAQCESMETNTYSKAFSKYIFDEYFDPEKPETSYYLVVDVNGGSYKLRTFFFKFTDRVIYNVLFNRNYISYILDETAKITHDYRIKNLLPIVTKNDVNPIEEAVKPIVTAFNAPLLAGLEDAYATIGVEFSDRQKALLDQYRQYVTSVKDELLMQIDKLSPSGQILLQTYYGIDEYNRIIKKLNGDDE